ncbi:MAG: transposase-like protein [Colwellia sp.]|jgi:transposase-like protein
MDIKQKNKHWKNIFVQQQSSGLSIIGLCRENKVNVSTFYGWRKQLASQTTQT